MLSVPRPPALTVIDAQRAVDDPRRGRRNNPGAEAAIADLLATWRRRGWPIVHLHRLPGAAGGATAGAGAETKPQARPRLDELLMWRAAPSAFADTGLHRLLATRGIDALVLCGFVTDEAVAATARHAAGLGYRVRVVADACAAFARDEGDDGDGGPAGAEAVHARSLAALAAAGAKVDDSAELLAGAPAY